MLLFNRGDEQLSSHRRRFSKLSVTGSSRRPCCFVKFAILLRSCFDPAPRYSSLLVVFVSLRVFNYLRCIMVMLSAFCVFDSLASSEHIHLELRLFVAASRRQLPCAVGCRVVSPVKSRKIQSFSWRHGCCNMLHMQNST